MEDLVCGEGGGYARVPPMGGLVSAVTLPHSSFSPDFIQLSRYNVCVKCGRNACFHVLRNVALTTTTKAQLQ